MKGKTYPRSNRVADLIKEEVALIFVSSVSDPRLQGITITDVRVGDDLKIAKVYYVYHSGKERKSVLEGLSKVKGYIRREISKRIKLKRIPELEFLYDDVFEQGMSLEKTLKDFDHGSDG